MKTVGRYIGTEYENGQQYITFAVDDFDPLTMSDELLTIETEPLKGKRSLNANRYLWKLCGEIAAVIRSDKDSVYLSLLKDYGVYEDYDLVQEGAEKLQSVYRYAERLYSYDSYRDDEVVRMVCVRCYRGSHEYDTRQMGVLLEGAVYEAKSLGIELQPDEYTNYLISQWKARKG